MKLTDGQVKALRNGIEDVTSYLELGGLFNPELMDHNTVRDMLMDFRDLARSLESSAEIAAKDARIAELEGALRPFACVPPEFNAEMRCLVVDAGQGPFHFSQSDLNRARTVLGRDET